MAKTKKIGGFWATMLIFALQAMGAFTRRITQENSRKIVDGMRLSFLELVRALSDSDPNDNDQIQGIVNRMVREGDFYQGTKGTIVANLAKIENDKVRTILMNLLNPAYSVADILTDDDPANGDQLRNVLMDLLSSADGIETINAALGLVFDEEAAAFIGAIIASYLEQIFDNEPEVAATFKLTRAEVIDLKQKYEEIAAEKTAAA